MAMRFKLLSGMHIKNDSEGREKKYRANDIVEDETNLAERFGADKFERLQDSAPRKVEVVEPVEALAPRTRDQFALMKVEELKELAEDNEIDISHCKKKEEIIDQLCKHF